MNLEAAWRARRPRIEIVPLIDVMFFLLVCFMWVRMEGDRSRAMTVNLPRVERTSRVTDGGPEALRIVVDARDRVGFESRWWAPGELKDHLAGRFAGLTNGAVRIVGDRLATHGRVVAVMAMARELGFRRISVGVQPEGEESQP